MKSLSKYSTHFKVGVAVGVLGEVLSGVANAAYRVQLGLELVKRSQQDLPIDNLQCNAAGFQSFMNGLQLVMIIATIALFIVRIQRRRGVSRIFVALCSVGMIGFAVGGILGIVLTPGGCFINEVIWAKILGCIGHGFVITSALLFVLAPEMRQSLKDMETTQLNPQGVVYASA